ncbi:MAG TPA: hypothetical protein VFE32_18515 [Puia sp.]|nr:hypothetical protein [Puia sp.]
MKWEFGLPEAFKTMHPHLSDSLPVFNGMPMIFKISNNGAFVTLVNWEQVKETYIRQMEMSLPRNPDSVALASIKAAEQMFNSKEAVESSLIKEIQLFHTLYGYQFTTRETSAETQLPNPFGGEGFPAHQTYQITNYDKRKDIYTIVTKLKIDKGNLNKIIDPLLKKMNIQDDGSIEEARNQLKSYNMEDYTEYHFTKSTGWISRLFYARTVSTAITNQSESFTIELK